ncbi:MAG TPA: hypothetical protein VLA99_03435 [Nitrospiraceae bacterium]|nr:hypothetical protein [Nitrospiraceae bacterium]
MADKSHGAVRAKSPDHGWFKSAKPSLSGYLGQGTAVALFRFNEQEAWRTYREKDRTVKFWKQCGDQEFLWLLVALIAMAVWVINIWVLDSDAVMTATSTVPPGL